ncbi:MAG TPA: response regulator [Puia sp.]|jgi:CheY-like chemotaxis protein|nr:response regulator [Puia sp.]
MPCKHILLIDDDEEDQLIFTTVLNSFDAEFSCTAFSDPEEALCRIESSGLTADLIFVDLRMPEMNGKQFLKELKKNETLAETPVIVLSAVTDPEAIREARELGARDFIIKPSTYSELRKYLSAVFHSVFNGMTLQA